MNKFIFLIFSCFILSFQAYGQSNWWMISTEYSPSSRSSNNRVLNSTNTANGSWRTRLGFKLGEQTFLGISGSYRSYTVRENTNYNDIVFDDIENPPTMNASFSYSQSNHLLGIGTFITQYFRMTEKFHLQVSAFGVVEQGRGRFRINMDNLECYTCIGFGNEFIINNFPIEIENTGFREQIYTAGLDVGASYFLAPRILVQGNLTMYIYEMHRTSSADLDRMYGLPTEAQRPLLQGGEQFNLLGELPVVHIGLMFLIGK